MNLLEAIMHASKGGALQAAAAMGALSKETGAGSNLLSQGLDAGGGLLGRLLNAGGDDGLAGKVFSLGKQLF